MRPRTALAALTLLLAGTLAAPAPAQRAYQKFWAEREKTAKPPAIVEDEAAPLDPALETYLHGSPISDVGLTTVFPGEPAKVLDPAAELALEQYMRGAITAESGSPVQALKSFGAALDKGATSPWVRLRVAESAMQLNDLSRAQTVLEDLLADDPGNHRAMLRMGQIHLMRQKNDDARGWFKKVLEVKPKNIEALTRLAEMAYLVDRNLEDTKKYSQEILWIDDQNRDGMLLNAEANAFAGDVNRAADLYARILRYQPGISERMMEIARRLAAQNRGDDAAIFYEKAMVVLPHRSDIRSAWERQLFQKGGEQAVRDAYKRIIAESKNDSDIGNLFAEYLLRAEDWEALRDLRETMLQNDPQHFDSLRDLAFYYLRKQDTATAESYFDRALATNPTDADLYRQIADEYLRAGQKDKARPLYAKALAFKPDDTRSMQAMALIEEQAGNAPEAERLLRRAIDLAPADAELLKRLGNLFLRTSQRVKAAELYQQVIAISPTDIQTWLSLAQLYFDEEDAAALSGLEKQAGDSLKGYPGFDIAYGQLALRHGEYERARRAIERALQESPEDLDARRSLAVAYNRLGLPDLALKALQDADGHLRGDANLVAKRDYLLAQTAMEARRYDLAEATAGNLLKYAPDDFDVIELQLVAMVRQGKEKETDTRLNEVVRQFGATKVRETQLLRASIYSLQGDSGRALAILRRLLAENPDDGEVKLQVAMAASESGDPLTAEKYYRELIDAGGPAENPLFETASNNLGYLFAQQNTRLDEAEKLVQQALAANPNAGYILDSLGWVYFQKGDLENARKHLEKAARLSGNDAEVHLHLGQLYEKIGDKELARASYERSLAADPEQKLAKERRDALAVPAAAEDTAKK